MAARSKLYFGAVDGSIAPRAVTGGVCYCCKSALVTGGDGSIFTAWRHVYPGNIRDIAFTMSRDGGRTFAQPVRVSEDKWELEGCPDDGPALAVGVQGRIHIVWPTLITTASADPTIALFHAASADGRRFTARQRIPTEGLPHHPQITIASDGSLVVAWDELLSGKRHVAMARGTVDASGSARFTREVVSDDDRAVYPSIAAVKDRTIVAWTSSTGSMSVIGVLGLPTAKKSP